MRCALLVALLGLCALAPALGQQALLDYVNKPDPHYSWYFTNQTLNTAGWTGYVLNLTSQGWLTAADTNRPVWTHQLVVIVPNTVSFTDTAAIYVTGNDNDAGPPSPTDEDILVAAFLAESTQSVTATLFQVPNQPTVFAADPEQKGRGEDSFVAFTWKMYMENQDRPEWVDLLPMVKSVVRAMDAVTEFLNDKKIANPSKFAIAGASKRGWTTWLTGAADPRVIGIVPIVMDMLNFVDNVMHMYTAYGGWTFAFKDYYALNITDTFGTPALDALAQIIDPLVYSNLLTMPKLVCDSTGDEFFMPDDDYFWWGKLQGETYRLMVANAEHSMATGLLDLLPGVQSFYLSLLTNSARPQFNWTIGNDGTITAYASTKPSLVVMYTATTFDAERRDFRLIKGNTPADPCKFIPVKVFGSACINPVLWFGETVAPVSSDGGIYKYVASQPLPDAGWRGFFLEFFFPGPKGSTFHMTTQVSIIPNTYPFPQCTPGECHGQLV